MARPLGENEHATWDSWLTSTEGANVRQLSRYRKGLSLYGHRSEIVAEERGGRILAGALLGIRDPGLGIGAMVHASGGLALEDPADAGALGDLVGALLDRCAELRASSVEITLRIPKALGDRAEPSASGLESVLLDHRFQPARRLGTYFVDLSASSEEELLSRFGKNPRRHIRRARREGMRIEPSLDPGDFEAFGEAHAMLCRRKKLVRLPSGFPLEVLRPLSLAGQGTLLVARYRDVPRNYLFAGSVRHPIYHWGAITEAAREPGCPQTGQVLHFAAMLHYRGLGRDVYDFGGSPGPVPDPSHPNFPVWKFKHEFGGTYVTFVGSWKRVLRPVRSAILETMRRGIAFKRRVLGS